MEHILTLILHYKLKQTKKEKEKEKLGKPNDCHQLFPLLLHLQFY